MLIIMPLLSCQLMLTALVGITQSSAFTAPSWDQLQATPAMANKPPRPIYQDALPTDYAAATSSLSQPILYRDKDCICIASETVWLAMECKNVDYLTVLVSKEDDDAIPRIEWPTNPNANVDNGEALELEVITNDPIKLLEQIQKAYPDNKPPFYPKLSAAVDAARCNIMRLPGVMPRYSKPEYMSHAPYLFKEDGTLAQRTSHCVSLEEVEEMQEEYYLGNYLCGRDVTAADLGEFLYILLMTYAVLYCGFAFSSSFLTYLKMPL